LTFPRMPRLAHSSRTFAAAAVLLLALLAFAGAPALAASSNDEAAQGWIRLFDGDSHFGWTAGGGDWQISRNELVSDPGAQSWLRSTISFSDFDLKFEARVSGGTATLLLRADPQSKPAQPGYTLSLNDGTISGLSGAAAAASPAGSGGWNTYEVKAEGTHLLASFNGSVSVDRNDTKSRIGYFEFAASRGTRVEVRSVLLKPLGLERLYDGSNLDGWRAVAAPPSKAKLKWPIPGLSGKPKPPPNVRWSGQGAIHGEGGEGQLESTGTYDDFVLQFTARSTAAFKDGHTGIEMFFRGAPNQFGSGYAVSTDRATDHQLQDGKSFGMGGLVKLEKSRAPSVGPGDFFTCTVIARAHRFSVWINGTLVTDYYDSRPDGLYHSAAGPLGFRIENENAILDLRDVEVASLPKGLEAPTPPKSIAAAASAAAVPAGPAPPAMPMMMPGSSTEERKQQEQIRKLTVEALGASTPEEAVRINKQILVLDPGDMPAQQRLDKAQSQIDAANAQRAHGKQERQATAVEQEANITRRSALALQAQDALLRGDPDEARDRLDDAQRLGANGPEVDRLHAFIRSRLRNRLALRMGLGGGGLLALIAPLVFLSRRRGKTVTAYLVALDGADKGKRYLLNQEVTHIGGVAMDGGKKNEVLVRDADRQVSRFHCEVHKRGNSCYLIDLDSSNGTFLHRRLLQPGVAAKLRDGDTFSLARTATFELRLERQRAG
jgi:hypothetical protein